MDFIEIAEGENFSPFHSPAARGSTPEERNLAHAAKGQGPEASALCSWYVRFAVNLKLDLPGWLAKAGVSLADSGAPSVQAMRVICGALPAGQAFTNGSVAIEARELGFDAIEADMLQAATDYFELRAVEMLWDGLIRSRGGRGQMSEFGSFALLIAVETGKGEVRLRHDAPLMESGLLDRCDRQTIEVAHRRSLPAARPAAICRRSSGPRLVGCGCRNTTLTAGAGDHLKSAVLGGVGHCDRLRWHSRPTLPKTIREFPPPARTLPSDHRQTASECDQRRRGPRRG